MNHRRALAIVLIIAFLALAALFLFYMSGRDRAISPAIPPFGSEDPAFGSSPDAEPGSQGGISARDEGEAPLDPVSVSPCDSPVSIERNDCIKRVAVDAKDESLCGEISGLLGQADCRNAVMKVEERVADISTGATVRYDFEFASQEGVADPFRPSLSSIGDALEKLRQSVAEARNNPDSRYTADGFLSRLASTTPRLFSFSRFQALPGTEIVAQGMGFTKENNEIRLGSYAVSGLSSDDGMTLRFTLPGSMEYGTYEAWVTNERGSSRNAGQPIQITITDSPLSPPTITGVSPSVPALSDTVTLYGSGFRGASGLYTSLGILENIYAGDSSITFKVSDFPLVSRIKDERWVKGSLVSVSVVVAAPQGYNQEPFVFNVQF